MRRLRRDSGSGILSASKTRCLWNINMHGMMLNDLVYEMKYQMLTKIQDTPNKNWCKYYGFRCLTQWIKTASSQT